MSEEIKEYQQPSNSEVEKEEVATKQLVDTLRDTLLGKADPEAPGLAFFLGTDSEAHSIIYTTAATYLGYTSAEREGRTRQAEVLKKKFEELREEHFKEVDEAELLGMLPNYFAFHFNGLDRAMMRREVIETLRRDNWTNTIPVNDQDGKRFRLVNAIPTKEKANLSVRDRMRRSYLRSSGDPDTFNIVLLNSLIVLRVKVPTPLELMRLINKIQLTLRQYGKRYNVSSLHLERAGIAQILTDFILDKAVWWSVKDTVDPHDLKKLIYVNDINLIAQDLLTISSPKGVVFRMYCLAEKSCGHSENLLIDPASMILHVEEAMSEKRREILHEILIKGRKLSREELMDLPPVYLDEEGKEVDTVIPFENEFGTGRLHISVPFLDEYFDCYARMGERVNPELRQLAVDYPNDKEFQQKRTEHMSAIRMADYLQWFRTYEMDPAPGTGDEPDVIHRDEDPKGFDDALIDIFNADEELYARCLMKVITTAPRMTFTFVGIRDDICPACKKRASEKFHLLHRSFTPVDPIINFFDHTRMMIGTRADQQTLQEDSLS